MIAVKLCKIRLPHDPHRRSFLRIFGQRCPGMTTEFCGKPSTHAPHWPGGRRSVVCLGLGLAAICVHGVQMLNHCDTCKGGNTQ